MYICLTNNIVISTNDLEDGWVLEIGFDDVNCQGTIMAYTSISEGNCVEIFNSTNYIFNASVTPPIVGSYKATCNANSTHIIVNQYSDSNCTNYISNITGIYYLILYIFIFYYIFFIIYLFILYFFFKKESIGCSNNGDEIFHDSLSSNFKSTYLSCSVGNQLPEEVSGNYVILDGYSDNYCESNSKIYFEAYVENVCFSTEFGSFLFTILPGNFQSPTLNTYTDQDCTSSKYFASPMVSFCIDTNYFNNYYRNFTVDYYNENSILTMKLQYVVSPTHSPSMLPTSPTTSPTLSPSYAIGDPTPTPTEIPTPLPTTNSSLPTIEPTLSPTSDDIPILGWIVAANYAGLNCSNSTIPNEIISYTGIPSGVCMVNYNTSNGIYTGISSYMFQCPSVDDEENYVITLQSYSDLECKDVNFGSLFRIDSGCSDLPDVLTSVIATVGFPEEHSTSMMCQNGPEIPSILDNKDYVKFTGYFDEQCGINNQSFFEAIVTGNCAKFKTVDYGVLSVQFVNGIEGQPNVKALLYNNQDCSGTGIPQFSNFPSCANYENSDFTAQPKVNQLLYQGIKRAKSFTFTSHEVPSPPSVSPTLSPTEPSGTVVTFDVTNHRLDGLNIIEFYGDDTSLVVFQGAINDCLDSLGPITIDITNPLSPTRRKLQSVFDNYVLVNYTVSFNMKYTVNTYSSINDAFTDFSNKLSNDITNLVFQNYLQSYEGGINIIICFFLFIFIYLIIVIINFF
jgi:hypothetical protein